MDYNNSCRQRSAGEQFVVRVKGFKLKIAGSSFCKSFNFTICVQFCINFFLITKVVIYIFELVMKKVGI